MSHNSKYYRKKLKKDDNEKLKSRSLKDFGFFQVSEDQPVSAALASAVTESNTSSADIVSDSSPSSDCVTNLKSNVSDPTERDNTDTAMSEYICNTTLTVSSPSVDSITVTAASNVSDSIESDHPDPAVKECQSIRSLICSTVSKPKGKLNRPCATLLAKYEQQYKWLYFSASKSGYICKYCELFPEARSSSNPPVFVQGTTLGDHPLRKLDKHDSSDVHKLASQKYMSQVTQSHTYGRPLFPSFQHKEIVATNRQYMNALIDTIMLIITNRWALDKVSDVMQHCDRLESRPIKKFKDMNKSLSLSYTSSSSVTNMVEAMNSYFEKILFDDIERADYVALLADESTDEANRTQLAVMIRMLTTNVIRDHFLGIVNVKRTDAASLMEAIETLLGSCHIDINKIMFVGFDGCNTMSGELKGVQRRFRHVVPHSIYINCRSHRLALCVKHLMKEFPVLHDVDEVLLGVYKLFEYSPQKFAVFKDVQSAYEKKELVLVRAAATRWLSHGKACKRFIDRYVEIIDSLDTILERTHQPEVVGVRDMVTNKNTLAAIVVLCDILEPVNYFCKYLQGSVDFTQVTIKLKELIDTLEGLADRFRGTLQDNNTALTMSKLPKLFEEVDERTVFARRMRNQNVYTQEQVVHVLACPMVNKLIGELQDGFHTSPVLSAFSVFNLNNLPETMAELSDYGKEPIQTLISHYGEMKEDLYAGHRSQAAPLLNRQAVSAEFEGFKHMMFLARNRGQTDMLQELLADDRLRTSYESMFRLILLERLIPSSTASVERLFSLMNSLCTVNRNRLGQTTLTSLMRLCSLDTRVLTDMEKEGILNTFKDMKTREIQL